MFNIEDVLITKLTPLELHALWRDINTDELDLDRVEKHLQKINAEMGQETPKKKPKGA